MADSYDSGARTLDAARELGPNKPMTFKSPSASKAMLRDETYVPVRGRSD